MQVGAPLPLSLQLADRNAAKFVRAFIRDNTGAQIVGSPAAMPIVANGLYQNLSLSYPNVPFLTVQYLVYDDAGFTTLSTTEGATSATFFIDPPAPTPGSGLGFYPINLIGVLESNLNACPSINGIQDTVVQNSDRNVTIRITNPDGSPFDLTNTTQIKCRFLNEDMSVLELTSTSGGNPIVVLNADQGSFQCSLTKVQTALLMPESPVAFSVVLVTSTGTLVVNFPYQLAVQVEAV